MSSSDRLSLIATICARRAATIPRLDWSVVALIAPLAEEERDAKGLVAWRNDDQSTDDRTPEDGEQMVSPDLASVLDSAPDHGRADELLLTPSEKRQIAEDMRLHRRRFWITPYVGPRTIADLLKA